MAAIHFCARRCGETCILKFWMARRCSQTHILILLDEPSRRIRWVDCAKLWRIANFQVLELLRALSWACDDDVLEASSVKFEGSLARNDQFRKLLL